MSATLRRSVSFFLSLAISGYLAAQVPTKCLEIEGVLVDACNSACGSAAQEGENEMFRFMVGPSPISLSDLNAQWATANPFLGWVQNATTASLTAQLNATITNCGWLVEPPGGVIPAGTRVLGITSTAMCVAGNSFAGLSDTLYIIYQNAGNTFGHFKNTNNNANITNWPTGPTAFRTFILSVPSVACSDSVTYNLSLLVNQLGAYGGDYATNDGSSLVVGWPGSPTVDYVNLGCQAPYTPLQASINTPPPTLACGSSIALEASTVGNVTSVHWAGGTGTYSSSNTLSTTYTLAASETTDVVLSFCAVSLCGDTVCDQLQVQVLPSPVPSVVVDPAPLPCGTAASLVGNVAGAATSLFWQGGAGVWGTPLEPATTYTPASNESGAIPLSFCAVGNCGDTTCTVFNITVEGAPTASIAANGPTEICAGSSVVLTAEGGSTYSWNTGATTAVLEVTDAGTYTATASNACGSGTAEITVTVVAAPVAVVTGPLTSCPDQIITLTAAGGDSYSWSTGDAGDLIQVDQPGTYTVTVAADCGSDTATITVAQGVAWQPSFTVDIDQGCSPLCVRFAATELGDASYTWDLGDGAIASGLSVEHCYTSGNYPVTLTATSTGYATECPGTSTLPAPIQAWPLPEARIGASPPTTTIEHPTFQFMDLGSGAETWAWTFGEGADSTSEQRTPVFTYDSVACYTVTLKVTSSMGCVDSTWLDVCVEDPYSLWVPNAFTPNGDGYNDIFLPVTTVITPAEFRLSIFDRWGRELFVSTSPYQGWNGADATNDVYVWLVRMRDTLGQQHERTGHVTLVR